MKTFTSFDGTRIAYDQWGDDAHGPWVVLHHGFIADARTNWVRTGVVDALVSAGRRVAALDARSHGRSDKPTDPARCGEANMARDLQALFDLLGEPEVDLVGYSMGAVVALLTASLDSRVRRLVVGGVGEGIVVRGGVDTRVLDSRVLVHALSTDDPARIDDPTGRAFRTFADAVGADRAGLVAHCQAIHQRPIALGDIRAPTLVVVGEDDALARRPDVLVQAIPDARLARVPGNHLMAVARPEFARSLVGFLAG